MQLETRKDMSLLNVDITLQNENYLLRDFFQLKSRLCTLTKVRPSLLRVRTLLGFFKWRSYSSAHAYSYILLLS